jgi:hypothetical protein
MTVHDVISHPVFLSWWGAFSVDLFLWIKAPGWKLMDFDFGVASKRWVVGILMGLLPWLGLSVS